MKLWLVLLSISFPAYADSPFVALRANRLLTDQTSITQRLDLCVAAASVNLAQALAVKLGHAPLSQPHDLFESIVEQYPGVNDDIGVYEMTQILGRVLARVFPKKRFAVEALLLDRYQENKMDGIQHREQLDVADLTPSDGELKILNVDLFDGAGNYIGGHAVVVDALSDGELKFVNSFEPFADSRARIFANPGTMWKGHQIPTFRIVSPRPVSVKAPLVFFVRGVVTVRIDPLWP